MPEGDGTGSATDDGKSTKTDDKGGNGNPDGPGAGNQDEDTELGPKGEKALEAFKARARDAEARAKKVETELEELRKERMTAEEKAVADAKAEGVREGEKKSAVRLVDAEVRAAAAGRPKELVTALLEGLDRSRFVGADGEPDTEAIQKWVDTVLPAGDGTVLDLGQGVRTGGAGGTDMNSRIRDRMR